MRDYSLRVAPGDRNPLYVARTLLQSADFIVFHKSFAALDLGNLGDY